MRTVEQLTQDVDLTVRTEDEWARIYHMRLGTQIIDRNGMDEFEWAWRLQQLRYQLLPDAQGSTDVATQMEARAMRIACEVLLTADPYERRALRSGRYLETKYIIGYRDKR